MLFVFVLKYVINNFFLVKLICKILGVVNDFIYGIYGFGDVVFFVIIFY